MNHLQVNDNCYRDVAQNISNSNYSISELAHKLGLSTEEMYSYLTGFRNFRFYQLIELSFYIDIKLFFCFRLTPYYLFVLYRLLIIRIFHPEAFLFANFGDGFRPFLRFRRRLRSRKEYNCPWTWCGN